MYIVPTTESPTSEPTSQPTTSDPTNAQTVEPTLYPTKTPTAPQGINAQHICFFFPHKFAINYNIFYHFSKIYVLCQKRFRQ